MWSNTVIYCQCLIVSSNTISCTEHLFPRGHGTNAINSLNSLFKVHFMHLVHFPVSRTRTSVSFQDRLLWCLLPLHHYIVQLSEGGTMLIWLVMTETVSKDNTFLKIQPNFPVPLFACSQKSIATACALTGCTSESQKHTPQSDVRLIVMFAFLLVWFMTAVFLHS